MAKKQPDVEFEAAASLERIQSFDVSSLPREDELGRELNFADAVPHATKIIDLYKQLSLSVLDDLPDNQLNVIKDQANADFNLLTQILEFTTTVDNPHNVRNQSIESLKNRFQPLFNQLHPLISYSTSKSADFKRLELEARASIQTVRDEAKVIVDELAASREQANQVLTDVRKVAAEQGVSQQAIHFKDEAERHSTEAKGWYKWTVFYSIGLLIWAIATLFIHKLLFLNPNSNYESFQLAVSKVLVFAVISYMLYLSARNFLSHKHNAIVNKHRQDALMTFKALVDAAQQSDNRDIVLNHAAACIFAPQATGYTRDSTDGATAKSVVELIAKPLTGGGD